MKFDFDKDLVILDNAFTPIGVAHQIEKFWNTKELGKFMVGKSHLLSGEDLFEYILFAGSDENTFTILIITSGWDGYFGRKTVLSIHDLPLEMIKCFKFEDEIHSNISIAKKIKRSIKRKSKIKTMWQNGEGDQVKTLICEELIEGFKKIGVFKRFSTLY